MDVTGYLETYRMTARELARAMILDVLHTTGITATAGIGTQPLSLQGGHGHRWPSTFRRIENGVRIAQLDERSYRAAALGAPSPDGFLAGGPRLREKAGGARAVYHGRRCPLLHREARTSITTRTCSTSSSASTPSCSSTTPGAGSRARMADIKAYRPETNSISSGQVLQCPYLL